MKKILISCAVIAASVFPSFAQWAPAGDNISTPWASEISPDIIPLEEYPRPQMVRSKWANLNGLWNYAVSDGAAEAMPASEGRI
ncbi:MAG: beta-galactosidase, partial [Candidatus Cryptobacteroides sp.]